MMKLWIKYNQDIKHQFVYVLAASYTIIIIIIIINGSWFNSLYLVLLDSSLTLTVVHVYYIYSGI